MVSWSVRFDSVGGEVLIFRLFCLMDCYCNGKNGVTVELKYIQRLFCSQYVMLCVLIIYFIKCNLSACEFWLIFFKSGSWTILDVQNGICKNDKMLVDCNRIKYWGWIKHNIKPVVLNLFPFLYKLLFYSVRVDYIAINLKPVYTSVCNMKCTNWGRGGGRGVKRKGSKCYWIKKQVELSCIHPSILLWHYCMKLVYFIVLQTYKETATILMLYNKSIYVVSGI